MLKLHCDFCDEDLSFRYNMHYFKLFRPRLFSIGKSKKECDICPTCLKKIIECKEAILRSTVQLSKKTLDLCRETEEETRGNRDDN